MLSYFAYSVLWCLFPKSKFLLDDAFKWRKKRQRRNQYQFYARPVLQKFASLDQFVCTEVDNCCRLMDIYDLKWDILSLSYRYHRHKTFLTDIWMVLFFSYLHKNVMYDLSVICRIHNLRTNFKIPFYFVPPIVSRLGHTLSFIWGPYVACQGMALVSHWGSLDNHRMDTSADV